MPKSPFSLCLEKKSWILSLLLPSSQPERTSEYQSHQQSPTEISDVKTDEGSPHLPRLRHDVDFLVTPLLLNAATPTFRQPFRSLVTVPVSAISY